MKRLVALFALCAALVCTACAGGGSAGSAETLGTGPAAGSSVVSPQSESMTQKIGELLSSDSYDKLMARIYRGDIPGELLFVSADGTECPVHDPDVIARAWKEISILEVSSVPANIAVPEDDKPDSFAFAWADGTKDSYSFAMSRFFALDGSHYELADSARLKELTDSLLSYHASGIDKILVDISSSEGGLASLPVVPYENASFSWDIDGDGKDEQFTTSYVDNGDEAMSLTTVSFMRDGEEVSAYLFGVLEITQVQAYVSEDGTSRALVLSYLQGEDAAHTTPGVCVLMYYNGQLVLATLA